MGFRSFFAKFLGPRIDESFVRSLYTRNDDEKLEFGEGKVIKLRNSVPGWGGRIAIVIGFNNENNRPVSYVVAVQDPDNPRIFHRIARGIRDNDTERAVDPRIIEELRNFGQVEFLSLNNPLIHEVELL